MEEIISEPAIEDILPEVNSRGLRLAHLISNVLSPPVVIAYGLLLIGITAPGTWNWMALYVLLVVGIPVAFLLYQLKTGQVSGFNVPIRKERYKLFVVVLMMTMIGWLTLWLGDAPFVLVLMTGIGVLLVLLLLVINLFWKISAHATTMSGFSMFIVAYLGWENWPVLFAIPVMAWARIRSDSHSFWQTIAGSITGAGFIFTVVSIITWQCGQFGLTCG